MSLTSIEHAKIQPKQKILVRCDLDVPIQNGQIQDEFRLQSCLKTLQYIIAHEATPIILGHMGRPTTLTEPNLSTHQLKPFFDKNLIPEHYQLLENTRFDPREAQNDLSFAKELVQQTQATAYVNEAFASSHREQTSITMLPKLLPSYAGFTLATEVQQLSTLFSNPKRPLTAIIGGAKLETKKPLVKKFLETADFVLLGGKLGLDWDTYQPSNLYMPTDYVENKDIGPETVKVYERIISRSQSIVWAGPMGLFEESKYAHGTQQIAQAIALATSHSAAFSVAGGGDTIHALAKLDMLSKFSFISTGGGAMLDFLSNQNLPGLSALSYNG
jgi:phosphoglycerate kinase